jgi:hypothetical protein
LLERRRAEAERFGIKKVVGPPALRNLSDLL